MLLWQPKSANCEVYTLREKQYSHINLICLWGWVINIISCPVVSEITRHELSESVGNILVSVGAGSCQGQAEHQAADSPAGDRCHCQWSRSPRLRSLTEWSRRRSSYNLCSQLEPGSRISHDPQIPIWWTCVSTLLLSLYLGVWIESLQFMYRFTMQLNPFDTKIHF